MTLRDRLAAFDDAPFGQRLANHATERLGFVVWFVRFYTNKHGASCPVFSVADHNQQAAIDAGLELN